MRTKEERVDHLVEWAVWAHLDSKTDLELLLLKGHLWLENIMNTALTRNNVNNYNDYSFYRKIISLENIDFKDAVLKDFILLSLQTLNKLRNQVAHELLFDITNGEFKAWSLNILENLRGTNFTKYTCRTKIVHSFSILSINILELGDLDDNFQVKNGNK